MTPLEIRQLPNAGAEILGCDLAELTVGDANQLEAAFAAFGLLVFRDQVIAPEDLAGFASRWGTAVVPGEAGDDVSVVQRSASVGDEPGVWYGGNSFSEKPDLGMVVFVPQGSGSVPDEISFASLASAFDALSGPTCRALEGLRATHKSSDGSEFAHPLVIRHPVSGKSSIYTNPAYAMSVEGMAEGAGLQLLNELIDHCQRDEFVVTVDWEPGTVILWDNRALWHFDRSEPTDASNILRVRIEGTALKPAVRPDKSDPSLTQRAGATLAGGIITAAMTGIAEVIEPERARQDIEIVSEAPDREPLDDTLDFGGLPPLD